MTTQIDLQKLAEIAVKTSILLDFLDASRAAYGALESGAQGVVRGEMASRLAELLRRTAPEEALALLEREAQALCAQGEAGARLAEAVAIVRVHALLDLMRPEEARRAAAHIPTQPVTRRGRAGGGALVKARLAYLVDRALALTEIEDAADDTADEEVRAEALLLRAKWRMETGDLDGAAQDLDALGWLVAAHSAVGTGMMLVVLQRTLEAMRANLGDAMAGGVSALADHWEQALLDGVVIDPLALGSIPPALHALTVRLGREQPGLWVQLALTLAGLQESAGAFQRSYTTLRYGAALAERLFGQGSGEDLRKHLAWLQARLGDDRFLALEAHELRRAEALANLARKPTAPDAPDAPDAL